MSEQIYLSAWQVKEEAFPGTGTPEEQLRFLLNYAILAPSSHNSQPWLFRIKGDSLELFADRERSLRATDPGDRELVISCGAALFNLRVAMYYFGRVGDARPFPDPRQRDLLARVALNGSGFYRKEWGDLFKAIPLRITNRGRFDPNDVPHALAPALRAAARVEGAWLSTFTRAHVKEALGSLVSEGDRIQFDNPYFRRELAAWLHSARDKDGLPGYAEGASELLDFATPAIAFLVRTFDLGNGVAARDNALARGSPLLACLGTVRDDPLAWLNAGQALQRALLVATAQGYQASFLNQPIEVAHLRPRLATLSEQQGYPQILLRIGSGAPGRHTPRRPLEDVLIEDGEPAGLPPREVDLHQGT